MYNYRIIKNTHKFETYLVKLPDNLRIPLTKFRCRNHKLPIEYGIYARVDRTYRLCTHCDKLSDKFHYLFECVKFQDQRKLFLKRYYIKYPSCLKMEELYNSKGRCLLIFCKFVNIIINTVDKDFLKIKIPSNSF